MLTTVDPDPKKTRENLAAKTIHKLQFTVYEIDAMRGIQKFGSGLKWLAQDRTWLTHFCRIGDNPKPPVKKAFYYGLLVESSR